MRNDTPPQLPSLGEISEGRWAALAARTIFFGHQSVGGNVMAGVADLVAQHPAIRLRVVESRDFSSSTQPAFHHAPIGRNDHPSEKLDDFVAVASAGFGRRGGIAMVKLCYVDIHTHTNPRALFDQYRSRIADLRASAPLLQIVHCTVPLTSVENWKGRIMAAVRRNATQRDRNLVRERYNELVRQAYVGREPLFDIARLESTLPDGRRATFQSGADTGYMLAPEYTDDGGHLNAAARRRVAEQLLVLLARLEPAAAPATSHGQPAR